MSIGFPARRLIIDHRTQVINIERRDGSLEVRPLRITAPRGALQILRSEYDVDASELHLTLPAGDRVTVEVGPAGIRGRRSIVYLDQNHWIALARSIYAPSKQSAAVNAAAVTIIELALSKAIILPLSSAHAVETARSDGRFRRHLATTMLTLSRSWQMRNPLKIRAVELAATLRGDMAVAADVMTLEPGSLFASDDGAVPKRMNSVDELHSCVTWISAFFDVMIEDEKEDSDRARELATTWARSYQALANHLSEARVPKAQIREVALAAFWSELRDDIGRAARNAGISPEALSMWMERDADSVIATMPHLGRYRELLLHRLRNADERWEPNDLIDANFLSCAAGYADLVVGEKKHTNFLLQTRRAVRPGADLVWKLPDAAAWLKSRAISGVS